MNKSSIALFERALNIFPGGVNSPVRSFKSLDGLSPIFFKSAKGAYITSVEGKDYIDFCQSFGPNILGHRDPDVTAAVSDMIQTAWTLGACEPYSLELAEFIKDKVSFLEKIRFVCSGTEAVMTVLRIARAATQRKYIIKFDGCYHGHTDSMLVKSGSGLAGSGESDSMGVSENVAADTLVAKLDKEESVQKLFDKYKTDIAAIIIEPLPANNGLLPQRKEFLEFLFHIAHKNKALVIFDEVISGFRVHQEGMAGELSLKPDLVTYGKVIGGGFPVGCYGGKKEYMDLISPEGGVYQAGTLSANPIAMCAGMATLKKSYELNLWENLPSRCDYFIKRLNDLFESENAPLQAISKGSLFWIHEKSCKLHRDLSFFSESFRQNFTIFFSKLLDEGIYLSPSPYEVCFMSEAHNDEVLDESFYAIAKALKKAF